MTNSSKRWFGSLLLALVVAAWGQFLDHTMDLRNTDSEAVTLPTDENDPPEGSSNPTEALRVSRSGAVSEGSVRGQINTTIKVATEVGRYRQAELDALRAAGIEVEVVGDEVKMALPLDIAFANFDLVP